MELSEPSLGVSRLTVDKYTFLLAHPRMTYESPYEAEDLVSAVDDGIQGTYNTILLYSVPVVADLLMMILRARCAYDVFVRRKCYHLACSLLLSRIGRR